MSWEQQFNYSPATRVVCGIPCTDVLGARPVSGFPVIQKQNFKVQRLSNSTPSTIRCTTSTTAFSSTITAAATSASMSQHKWRGGVEQVLNCDVDAAWQLQADYLGLCKWAPTVAVCEQRGHEGEEGRDGANAVGCLRYCKSRDGTTWVHERLLELDHARRYMSYCMEDNHFVFPEGFRGYVAKVQLEDAGEGKTLAKWTYEVDPVATQTKESLSNFMVGFYTLNLQLLEAGAKKLTAEAADSPTLTHSSEDLKSQAAATSAQGRPINSQLNSTY